MKSLIKTLCILLLLNTNGLYSQTWPKYYGQVNRNERVTDIIEMYDKGYLICSFYNSADWSQRWGWLIKTDVNGTIIWEKVIENTGGIFIPFAIEQTHDGGILICGGWRHSNKSYPIVMKLNACGEKEWCKIFEGSPNATPTALDIKETESGDIVVLVSIFGSIPEETVHLFKLDANGTVLWQEPFATTYNHPNSNIKLPVSLYITSDNKYLISGRGYWKHPWAPTSPYVYLRPFFIMADSSGNEEWVLPFGLNDTIIGGARSTIEKDSNYIIGLAAKWDINNIYTLFLRFDKYGIEYGFSYLNPTSINPNLLSAELSKMVMKDSLYYAQGIIEFTTPNQPFHVTVVTLDTNLFDSTPVVYDYLIQTNTVGPDSFDSTFDFKLLSSSSTSQPSGTNRDIVLAKLNLNLEYDTAYTGNFTYDSLCIPGPPQSGFVFLNNCDVVLGTDMPTAWEFRERISTIPISVFPNPANEIITFALENTEHHRNVELHCFNLLGVLQYQTRMANGQRQVTANVSSWPPGMYIVVTYSNGKPVGREKFVVRR